MRWLVLLLAACSSNTPQEVEEAPDGGRGVDETPDGGVTDAAEIEPAPAPSGTQDPRIPEGFPAPFPAQGQGDPVHPDLNQWGPSAIATDVEVLSIGGFDVDGDGVVDNLAGERHLGRMTAASMQKTVDDGDARLLVELRGHQQNPDCFSINFYYAPRGEGPPEEGVAYEVDPVTLTEESHAVMALHCVSLVDGVIYGRADAIQFKVPYQNSWATLDFSRVHFQAGIELESSGVRLRWAILGGALSPARLVATISGRTGAASAVDYRDFLGEPDQDLDGDGCPDAFSGVVWLEGVPATISGVAERATDPGVGSASCAQSRDCIQECLVLHEGLHWTCLGECLAGASAQARDAVKALLDCPVIHCAKEPDPGACMASSWPQSWNACADL